jgi:ribosomal protein S18 acetylase RimI-like enzyme
MIIRKGKLSDAKELFKIIETTPELHAAEDSAESMYSLNWIKAFLTAKDSALVLIAEENKKIIGFIIAEIWKKHGYSFLSNISIQPDFRRKGVGSMLYEKYEAHCKKLKLKCINYLVLATNEKMQNWSDKHGFKKGKLLYYYEKEI